MKDFMSYRGGPFYCRLPIILKRIACFSPKIMEDFSQSQFNLERIVVGANINERMAKIQKLSSNAIK